MRRTARVLIEGGASAVLVVVAPGEAGEAVASAAGGLAGVTPVVNPAPGRGMLSSVQAGLALARQDADNTSWVMVCPCDLPLLEPGAVRSVLSLLGHTNAQVVVPTFDGKRGHPTAFHASLWAEIRGLAPETFGLNTVLKRHAGRVREVAVDHRGVVTDADTPQEWQAAVMGDKGSHGGAQ